MLRSIVQNCGPLTCTLFMWLTNMVLKSGTARGDPRHRHHVLSQVSITLHILGHFDRLAVGRKR